jgi:hypothetical protein
MSDFPARITPEALIAYLDNTLSAADRAALEKSLALDPEAQGQVAAQQAFDARIRKQFAPPEMSVQDVVRLLPSADSRPSPQNPRTRRRTLFALAASVVVASLAWAAVVWQWNSDSSIEPYFQPRSLVEIYSETVDQGFRPYYFCEDENRFAATFALRQAVPLRLAPLPPDRQMVGLSYSGGLSRDTTAVLCHVRDSPVIVFVDRKQLDNPAIATSSSEPGIHVHRKELDELVIYEVTPFDTPLVSDYLQIVDQREIELDAL